MQNGARINIEAHHECPCRMNRADLATTRRARPNPVDKKEAFERIKRALKKHTVKNFCGLGSCFGNNNAKWN